MVAMRNCFTMLACSSTVSCACNAAQINRIEWHYFINGEFNSIQNLDMRMFFPQELDSYLEWNGFSIIHKYGGFEEEIFNDDSEKQVFVCQCKFGY